MNKATQNIKAEIRNLSGYAAPPQGKVIAKLNQNENPYELPAEIKTQVLDAMKDKNWGRYPNNNPVDLREKLAKRFNLTAEHLILGNGSNQLLYAIATAVIEPGDEVLLAPPTFSLNELIVTLFQAKIKTVLKKDDLNYDEDSFLEASRTAKLIFLCSPDNPTGLSIELDYLEAVLKTTNGLVIWDEAYSEFWGQTAAPLVEQYPNLLIIRTFSKAFSMAGLRVGYVMTHPEIASQLYKVNIPYNINQFSATATEILLENMDWVDKHIEIIIKDRETLFNKLQDMDGIHPYSSQANFILFQIPNAKTVLGKLQEKGVLIRDMTYYPKLESALRVTIGTPEENNIFIKTLKKVI